MPKINRTRLVNVIYGDNLSRCIPDLITDAQGEDCLHKLINNGGKSIISCFMLQPFAWQYDKYPRTATDPLYNIKKYFTEKGNNTEPCYILQELILEDGSYLLVGVGLQNLSPTEPLNKISFIYKYNDMNSLNSLSNFELYRSDEEGRKIILNVSELDERFKKSKYTSELRGVYRRRTEDYSKFYEELESYHITKEEIFNIYIKFNAKECNVATLFTKDKITTSTKLVDTWILPYINEKINKENTEFLSDIIKALANYTVHKKEKDTVLKTLSQFQEFLNDWEVFEQLVMKRSELVQEETYRKGQLAWLKGKALLIQGTLENEIEDLADSITNIQEELEVMLYEQTSYQIKQKLNQYNHSEHELHQLYGEVSELESQLLKLNQEQKLLTAKRDYDEWKKQEHRIEILKAKQNPEERKLLEEKSRNICYSLQFGVKSEKSHLEKQIDEKNRTIQTIKREMETNKNEIKFLREELQSLTEQYGSAHATVEYHKNQITELCEQFQINSTVVVSGRNPLTISVVNDAKNEIKRETEILQKKNDDICKKQEVIKKHIDEWIDSKNQACIEYKSTENIYSTTKVEYENCNEKLQNIQFFAERIGIEYTAVEQIDSVLDARIKNTLDQIGEKEKECNWIKELFQFYQGDANDMNAMIEAELKHANIDYIKGSDYILKYQGSIERIVEKIPFLPYAILVSKDSYAKVERIQLNEYTKTILPILILEELEQYEFQRTGNVYSIGNIGFFGGYDDNFYSSEYIKEKIKYYTQQLETVKIELDQLDDNINVMKQLQQMIFLFTELTKENTLEELEAKLTSYESIMTKWKNKISEYDSQMNDAKETLKNSENELEQINIELDDWKRKAADLTNLEQILEKYDGLLDMERKLFDQKDQCFKSIDDKEETCSLLEQKLEDTRTKYNDLQLSLNGLLNSEYAKYLETTYDGELIYDDNQLLLTKEDLMEQLNLLMNDERFQELKTIEHQIEEATRTARIAEREFKENYIDESELVGITYSRSYYNEVLQELDQRRKEKDAKKEIYDRKRGNLESFKQQIELVKHTCVIEYGKEYDILAESKNYEHEIIDLRNRKDQSVKEKLEKEKYKEKLAAVLNEWSVDSLVESVPYDEIVDEYNCLELKHKLNQMLTAVTSDKETNLENIRDTLREYQRTYVNGYQNDSLKTMLYQVEAAVKDETIQTEVTTKIRERLQMYIEKNSSDAEVLEKERSIIFRELLPKCEQILKELQTFDRYSVMNEERLIRLEKVASQGSDDAVIEEVEIAIDSAIKKDTMEEMIDEYTKKLTLPSLMRVYCNTPAIRVKVMKYEFTTQGSHFLTPFEYCHDNNGASGAQSLICVFEILLTLTRYLKASSPSKRDLNYGTFFFIDNPFGSITTSFFIDTLFSILNYFGAQLISFTDISETCILEANKHIFDYKFESRKDHFYLRANRIVGDSLPVEYLQTYKFEEKQLSLFDSM